MITCQFSSLILSIQKKYFPVIDDRNIFPSSSFSILHECRSCIKLQKRFFAFLDFGSTQMNLVFIVSQLQYYRPLEVTNNNSSIILSSLTKVFYSLLECLSRSIHKIIQEPSQSIIDTSGETIGPTYYKTPTKTREGQYGQFEKWFRNLQVLRF